MVRTIAIRIAANLSVRLRDNWQRTIQARVEAVSEIYEKEFNIRWSIVGFDDWNSNEFILDACDLIDDLEKKVAPGNAEIVLGVFGEHRKLTLGCTRPFSRMSLVLDVGDTIAEASKVMVLAHELAHLFGAWHSQDPQALMSASKYSTLKFDGQTRQIIELMRNYDFRKGIEAIDEKTLEKISAIFMTGHARGEVNPVSTAYAELAKSLHLAGNLEAALLHYRKAIQIDVKNAIAHDNLGNALNQQGDLDGAIAEHLKAIQLNPSYPLAHNNLGVTLREAGYLKSAICQFREAIRLNPNYVTAHYNLGETFFRQGEIHASMTEMREVIRLDPRHGNAHSFLAVLLYHAERYREAWDAVRKAQSLGGDVKPVFLSLLQEKMAEPRK